MSSVSLVVRARRRASASRVSIRGPRGAAAQPAGELRVLLAPPVGGVAVDARRARRQAHVPGLAVGRKKGRRPIGLAAFFRCRLCRSVSHRSANRMWPSCAMNDARRGCATIDAWDDLDRRYAELLEGARSDPNVLGVILAGSRAVADFATEHSDYDCWLILREPDSESWPFVRGSGIETVTATRRSVRIATRSSARPRSGTGRRSSTPEWNWTRSTDRCPACWKRSGRLGAEESDQLVRTALDDYINQPLPLAQESARWADARGPARWPRHRGLPADRRIRAAWPGSGHGASTSPSNWTESRSPSGFPVAGNGDLGRSGPCRTAGDCSPRPPIPEVPCLARHRRVRSACGRLGARRATPAGSGQPLTRSAARPVNPCQRSIVTWTYLGSISMP